MNKISSKINRIQNYPYSIQVHLLNQIHIHTCTTSGAGGLWTSCPWLPLSKLKSVLSPTGALFLAGLTLVEALAIVGGACWVQVPEEWRSSVGEMGPIDVFLLPIVAIPTMFFTLTEIQSSQNVDARPSRCHRGIPFSWHSEHWLGLAGIEGKQQSTDSNQVQQFNAGTRVLPTQTGST